MSEPLSLPERAGRAAVWNVLALGTLAVLTFATGILIARTLSKEEFGAYGRFIALVPTILAAIDLGLSASVPKFAAAATAEGGRRGLLRLLGFMAGLKLLLLGVVGFLVLVAGAPVARFLGLPESAPTWFLSVVILVACLDLLSDVCQQGLATMFAQGMLSAIRVAESITLSGLLIALVLAGQGVRGVLWAFVGASALKMTLSGACLMLRTRSMPAGAAIPMAPVLPRLARHAATSYAAKWTAYLAAPAFGTLVLGATSSEATVANFALVGDLVFKATELATSPVNFLLLSIFAHLVLLEDRAPVRRAFSVLIKVYAIALIPSMVGLVTLAPALFEVLYKGKYADAVPFFQVLTGFVFVELVFYPVASSAMISAERYRAFLASRLPIVFAAILAPTVVREAGPLAAVAVLAGSRVVSVALLLGAARRLLGATLPAAHLARQVVVATLLAVPLWFLVRSVSPGPMLLVGAILGYAALFLAISKATGGIGAEDRAALADMRIPFKRVLLWLF